MTKVLEKDSGGKGQSSINSSSVANPMLTLSTARSVSGSSTQSASVITMEHLLFLVQVQRDPLKATAPLIAAFLHFLFKSKKLSPRAIEGYKTAIADSIVWKISTIFFPTNSSIRSAPIKEYFFPNYGYDP